MSRRHRKSYHEWDRSTPLMDAMRPVVAAISVFIASWAVLFLAFAIRDGNRTQIVQYGAFLVVILAVNAAFEAVRRWRRHHG